MLHRITGITVKQQPSAVNVVAVFDFCWALHLLNDVLREKWTKKSFPHEFSTGLDIDANILLALVDVLWAGIKRYALHGLLASYTFENFQEYHGVLQSSGDSQLPVNMDGSQAT